MIKWTAIQALIPPEIVVGWHGVERSKVEKLRPTIKLPEIYLDLMSATGLESNGYQPFGIGFEHHFGIHEMNPELYPPARLLRVGKNVFFDIEREDKYLDLTRLDESNSPLVAHDQAGLFREEQVRDLETTLGTTLAQFAFEPFHVVTKPIRASLLAMSESHESATQNITKLYDIMCERVEPTIRGAAFIGWTSDAIAVSVRLEDTDVVVEIGTTEEVYRVELVAEMHEVINGLVAL